MLPTVDVTIPIELEVETNAHPLCVSHSSKSITEEENYHVGCSD